MADLIYGFMNLADIALQRAVTIDYTQLQSAVLISVQQHDQLINEVLDLFTEETQVNQLKYQGGIPSSENQPLDEFGRSRKVKGHQFYTSGFPIYSSGAARGFNFITNQKMTVQQYSNVLYGLFAGDAQWVRNRLFASLFSNVNRVYDDPTTFEGDITVLPLANGDAVTYSDIYNNLATDNHYLGFNNPIDDANNPFPTLWQEIIEHPGNDGEVVSLVASDVFNTDATHGVDQLSNFIEVARPHVVVGANVTTLNQNTIPGFTPPFRSIVRGLVDRQWIVEWPSLPAGYGITLTTNGPKPLKRRVDPEPELRGFKPIAERDDFPYYDEQWIRRMGFGAWNRVGMVVWKIGGAYSIPTKYQNMRW